MFIARVKNFLKWGFIDSFIACILSEVVSYSQFGLTLPSSLTDFFELLVFFLCIGFVSAAIKGLYNIFSGKQPWGLRHMQQTQTKQRRQKNKKRGVFGSILNAPHAAAQKGANAVGNKILSFGSGGNSGYNSRSAQQARKEAADQEVWEETQRANREAWQRYHNEDEACNQDYQASQSPEGSFDETMHKNYAQEYRNKNR